MGFLANDQRVLAWDIWNEPDNLNGSSYGKQEPPNKVELVLKLLPQTFAWARSAKPQQPLTSGVWQGDWSTEEKMSETARLQIALSDIVSFHNYDDAEEFEKRINWLARYRRPLLCTEYMARGNGSTFQGSLPVAKKHNVAAYNWGLVVGQDADASAVGLVAEAVHGPRAGGLVSRSLQDRRHALPRRRGRADQKADGQPKPASARWSWIQRAHAAFAVEP